MGHDRDRRVARQRRAGARDDVVLRRRRDRPVPPLLPASRIPATTPATVTVRYLVEGGPPVTRTHTLPPHSRTTISVNEDDPALAARVAGIGHHVGRADLRRTRDVRRTRGGTLGGGVGVGGIDRSSRRSGTSVKARPARSSSAFLVAC